MTRPVVFTVLTSIRCTSLFSFLVCLSTLRSSCTRVQNGGAPLMPPRYLHLDLPKHVMRNVSRFRLRAHSLAMESSIWCGGNGHRNKCYCAAVQIEVHVLFQCQDLFVCSLRRRNSFLFFPFFQSFFFGGPLYLKGKKGKTT